MSLKLYQKSYPKSKNLKMRYLIFCSFALVLTFLWVKSVSAQTCTPRYGGGEECVYNKRFSLEKKVKRDGESDSKYKDKIGDLEPGDKVVFRIIAKNTGDFKVDKVEIEDTLPKEFKKISGETEWEIEDFKPGEEVEFSFKAKVVDEEELGLNKEICVVNTVELFYKDDLENSDTATVCINTPVITTIKVEKELPKDGANFSLNLVVVTSLIFTGLLLRKAETAFN